MQNLIRAEMDIGYHVDSKMDKNIGRHVGTNISQLFRHHKEIKQV